MVTVSVKVDLVLSLVSYEGQRIEVTEQDWLQSLCKFMDKFYRYSHIHRGAHCMYVCRCEGRVGVRMAALGLLGQVLATHWLTQQDPLLRQAVLPFLSTVSLETDPDLRCEAVQLLLRFLPSSPPTHSHTLLDIVSQVMWQTVRV